MKTKNCLTIDVFYSTFNEIEFFNFEILDETTIEKIFAVVKSRKVLFL